MADMESEDIELQIQQYLDGNLRGLALKEFEHRLSNDHELAAEVQGLKNVEHNLRGIAYQELTSNIKEWEAAYQERNKRFTLKTYLAIAASLLIFLLVGYYTFQNINSDHDDLFAMYYAPYPDMILTRGDEVENAKQLVDGLQAYNSGNYTLASEILEAYTTQSSAETEAYLYLALAQLEINDVENAVANFEIAARDSKYRQQATWYEALLYVKSNKLGLAKESLRHIAESKNHYKSKEARQLLQKL